MTNRNQRLHFSAIFPVGTSDISVYQHDIHRIDINNDRNEYGNLRWIEEEAKKQTNKCIYLFILFI